MLNFSDFPTLQAMLNSLGVKTNGIPPSGVLLSANNLSDLANRLTALTNLHVTGVHSWRPSLIFGSQNNGAVYQVLQSGATNGNNFAGWLFAQNTTNYIHLRGMIPKSINTSIDDIQVSISCKTLSTNIAETGAFYIQAVNHAPGSIEDAAFSVPTLIAFNPPVNAYGTIILPRVDIALPNAMVWPEELEIRIYRIGNGAVNGDTLSQPLYLTDVDVLILTNEANDA